MPAIASHFAAQVLLISSAYAYLFSGIYKGVLGPLAGVDLTLVAGAVLVVLSLGISGRRVIQSVVSGPTLLLGSITAWMCLRLFPELSDFGIDKLQATVLLGAPAVLGGIALARTEAINNVGWLAWAAVPLAIILMATSDSGQFAQLGTGGYFATGLLFATLMVAGAASLNPVAFVAAAGGAAVTGNISGLVFGLFACGAAVSVLALRRSPQIARNVACAAFISVISLGGYVVATGGPPLVVSRTFQKAISVVFVAAGMNEETVVSGSGDLTPRRIGSEEALTALGMPVGSQVTDVLDALVPEGTSANSGDRILMYSSAVQHFLSCPAFGCGYGVPHYYSDLYPHNALLELLAEGGILAGALWIALMVVSARACRNSPFAMGLLVLFALTSLTNGYWGGRMMLLSVGIAAGFAPPVTIRLRALARRLYSGWQKSATTDR